MTYEKVTRRDVAAASVDQARKAWVRRNAAREVLRRADGRLAEMAERAVLAGASKAQVARAIAMTRQGLEDLLRRHGTGRVVPVVAEVERE